MSKITFGIGTSHSVLLNIDAALWFDRAKDDLRMQLTLSDGRTLSYDELLGEVGGSFAEHATLPQFETQSRMAHAALDRLAAELADAAPDLILIVGDDQKELFDLNNMPAISIYYGAEIVMHPRRIDSDLPDWRRQSISGYSMDAAHRHAAAPQYALGLIDRLMARGIDLGAVADVPDPARAGFGHAYGFVVERLMQRRGTPIVPVLLNTYFPPNVPHPARCYEIGQALREAVEEMPDDLSVAIIASGGLSHFVTDEKLDRGLLEGLGGRDAAALKSIPVEALRSGSSEILNWILAGGALEGLTLKWSEYFPVYRTPAGTGTGLAFAAWR